MTTVQPNTFSVAVGFLFFLLFLTFCFCVSTLKLYLDEDKVSEKAALQRYLKSPLPPFEFLNERGKIRYKIAVVTLIAAMICVTIIILHNQFLWRHDPNSGGYANGGGGPSTSSNTGNFNVTVGYGVGATGFVPITPAGTGVGGHAEINGSFALDTQNLGNSRLQISVSFAGMPFGVGAAAYVGQGPSASFSMEPLGTGVSRNPTTLHVEGGVGGPFPPFEGSV